MEDGFWRGQMRTGGDGEGRTNIGHGFDIAG